MNIHLSVFRRKIMQNSSADITIVISALFVKRKGKYIFKK